MEMEKVKQAYNEILELLKKYESICRYDLKALERQFEDHLFALKLKEEYGFNIDPKKVSFSNKFYRFDEYRYLSWFGKKYNRTISCSDNKLQPDDEFLLDLGFCTGPYIFSDSAFSRSDYYPKELFDEFFAELKSYNPKYIDTPNHNLYFSMDNAGKIFNEFDGILKKYRQKSGENYKKIKAAKLKAELEKLESEI